MGTEEDREGVAKADPRALRTRRMLVDALVRLCFEGEYGGITVADIAREAGVNRTTFYLHYEDKDDLLARGFEDMLDGLGQAFKERPGGLDEEAWRRRRVRSFFELLESRRPFFLALLSSGGAAPLAGRASAYLERFLADYRLSLLGRDSGSPPPSLLATAIVSTLSGLAGAWLRDPSLGSAEEMAELYVSFVRGGIVALGYREPDIPRTETLAGPVKTSE